MISSRQRNTALLVAGCFFMEQLDGTIVTTAAPRIGAALGVDSASIGVVITAYLVTLAVLIPVSGWLTACWGARPVFLSAIVIFTVASLACAFSISLGELVAFRVVQGIGGAMMVPVGRLVVISRADKADLLRMVSFVVWPALLAPVIAPLAGGLITTYASWRWLFAINVPLGGLALALAWRLIESGPLGARPRLDRLGVALTCSGMAAVTYTAHLLGARTVSWPLIAVAAAVSAGLVTSAVRHMRNVEQPLLDLRPLSVPTFRTAAGSGSLFWVAVAAVPFLMSLLFQNGFGWSPVKSGTVVLFVFIGNVAIKPLTTPMLNRFGFRAVLVAATAGAAVTIVAAGLVSAATPLAVIMTIALLSGVGRSVGLTVYSSIGFSEISAGGMRDANTLLATTQQLSAGLGVTAAAVALRAGVPLSGLLPGHPSSLSAYTVAFILVAVVSLLATAGALRLDPTAGDALRRRTPERQAATTG